MRSGSNILKYEVMYTTMFPHVGTIPNIYTIKSIRLCYSLYQYATYYSTHSLQRLIRCILYDSFLFDKNFFLGSVIGVIYLFYLANIWCIISAVLIVVQDRFILTPLYVHYKF